LKPKSWGLYDVHGNAKEWVSDWYGDYPNGPVTDPQGPNEGKTKVNRGGFWDSGPKFCRTALRFHSRPAGFDGNIGFRLARSQDQ
jgi:formylglycine-generating enzyme required for sulfatase activity